MKKFLIVVFTLAIFVVPMMAVLVVPVAVHADAAITTNDIPSATSVGLATKDLKEAIANIVNIVLSIMGIIFFVLFIIAGFKWMTAAGNEEAIESAKHIMTAAVIGLIITLLAWAISYWVVNSLQTRGFMAS